MKFLLLLLSIVSTYVYARECVNKAHLLMRCQNNYRRVFVRGECNKEMEYSRTYCVKKERDLFIISGSVEVADVNDAIGCNLAYVSGSFKEKATGWGENVGVTIEQVEKLLGNDLSTIFSQHLVVKNCYKGEYAVVIGKNPIERIESFEKFPTLVDFKCLNLVRAYRVY